MLYLGAYVEEGTGVELHHPRTERVAMVERVNALEAHRTRDHRAAEGQGGQGCI